MWQYALLVLHESLKLVRPEQWIEIAFMSATGIMGLLMIVPTVEKEDA